MIVPRASSIGEIMEQFAAGRSLHPTLVRIWGNSVRFPGQSVGLEHLVQDGDRIHLQS
jgi:ribosome-interacting GTPase 1